MSKEFIDALNLLAAERNLDREQLLISFEEALEQAFERNVMPGKQIGLSETEARETVEQTLLSSIATAFESGLSSSEVFDLIPVKPIGENEGQIKEIFQTKLLGLYGKIKP